jgi:hypothetical protein
MRKLFAIPVVAPFFFIFGVVLCQIGYAWIQRRSFHYTPQHGPTQIISPDTSPTLYWSLSAGLLALGVLCLIVSAYAGFRLVRAIRNRGRT